jgi:hypothetical protein
MFVAPFVVVSDTIIPGKHRFDNCTSIRHPFLPDKSLDGLFHILEDVPGDAAGGAAQHRQSLRGIELHHKDEVLGVVMGFGITAAPLQ